MLSSAEEIGVKLVGAWADGPAHTAYFVVETDAIEKLFDFVFPTLKIARAEVRLIEDTLALFKRRFAES